MSTDWSRPAARTETVETAAETVRQTAREITGPSDLDPLLEEIGDAKCVLIGEASHGTAEFYRWRSQLTARLLREHDFSFVGVEGDWTDCYDVTEFVKGKTDHESAETVLREFDRWPTWMWANWEVAEFVDWLAQHNADRRETTDPLDDRQQVGFYGLDVYSLYESMAAVINYLEEIDPEAAEQARDAYRCFEPYGEDPQEYAWSTRISPENCEAEVIEALEALQRREPGAEPESPDEYFNAEQNALVARNAESYYRAMVQGDTNSWNIRDKHMRDTLDRLLAYHGDDAKAVVWAHNTHVGDARATDMVHRGVVNLGQLARERYGDDEVALIGFGSHRGSVIAADGWGESMERKPVPEGIAGSYEDVFHRAVDTPSSGPDSDALLIGDEIKEVDPLAEPRGHRAIGVVYHPERERGNYVPTRLTERYDAFIHVDETEALHPLHIEPGGAEMPETYPWGV